MAGAKVCKVEAVRFKFHSAIEVNILRGVAPRARKDTLRLWQRVPVLPPLRSAQNARDAEGLGQSLNSHSLLLRFRPRTARPSGEAARRHLRRIASLATAVKRTSAMHLRANSRVMA